MQWIDEDSALARIVSEITRGPVALDTEADSFHHYREKVCLIQLTFEGRNLLLDTLSGLNMDLLRPVLENPEIHKVFHDADYDLRLLYRDFGLRIRGLFDTMIAARLVGERAFGLASLLETYRGVRLQKKYQLADWSRRPLPREMMEYAVSDTRHLLGLSRVLEEKLEGLGRIGWAREEFLRRESVRWTDEPEPPEAFSKVKGSSRMSRKELAILRDLCAWRDTLARERNVPLFKVLGDQVLVSLCRQTPRSTMELSRVKGIPARLLRGPLASKLLEKIERSMALPDSEWPVRPERVRRRVAGEVVESIRAIRKRRDTLARRLDLEPSLLATKGVLESIVSRMGRGEDWRTIPELRSWQVELLEPLLASGGPSSAT